MRAHTSDTILSNECQLLDWYFSGAQRNFSPPGICLFLSLKRAILINIFPFVKRRKHLHSEAAAFWFSSSCHATDYNTFDSDAQNCKLRDMTKIIEEFLVEHCCSCGVSFAITEDLHIRRRCDGGVFWCPNGHQQQFTESEIERLRKLLERTASELRAEKCVTMAEKQAREIAENAAARAQRKLKRVHKGVCPCCKRSFTNLARHMAIKHPDPAIIIK
jgi:hypothetical protein